MTGAEHVERLSSGEATGFIPTWYQAAQGEQFWMKKRFDFLRDALVAAQAPLDQPLRVLDVGSGNGVIRTQVEGCTRWSVDCADIDYRALCELPPGRGRTLFYDVTDRHPQLVGQYDVLLLLDVVEHIESPAPFLTASLDHLKPGGLVVINVPALPVLFSRYDECAGHYRRYTRTSLRAELRALPLARVVERYWGASMVPALLLRKVLVRGMKDRDQVIKLGFEPKARWIDALLAGTLTLEQKLLPRQPLGTSLIYIGRKT